MAQKTKSKNKNTVKYLAIAIPAILLIGGIYYFSQSSQQGIIGNKKILDEISTLLTLSGQRALTPADFSQLENMVAGDIIAEEYVADGKQFALYGVTTHAGHSLSNLYIYIFTGKDQVCIPHEVEHLGTFIRFNDFSRSDDILEKYENSYDEWLQRALDSQEKFPVLYENLDQLIDAMDRVVENYKEGNYQAVLAEMPFITENDFLGCAITV